MIGGCFRLRCAVGRQALQPMPVFDYCMNHDGILGLLPIVIIGTVPFVAVSGLAFLRLSEPLRHWLSIWHASVTMCAVAAVACASCALVYDLLQWRDPASRAAAGGEVVAVMVIRATSPAVSSDRRSNDCRLDARTCLSPSTAYSRTARRAYACMRISRMRKTQTRRHV